MTNCEHDNKRKGKVIEEWLGEKFTFTTEICSDCGAYLHNQATRKKFNVWMMDLYRKNESKFTVQVRLSKEAISLIEGLRATRPGLSFAEVAKAFFAVWYRLNKVEKYRLFFDEYLQSKKYQNYTVGTKEVKKVRLKPAAWMELTGISEAFEMPPAKILETIIYMFCSIYKEVEDRAQKPEETRIMADVADQLVAA